MNTSLPALDELQARLRIGNTVMVARFLRLSRSRDHRIHLRGEFSRKEIHVNVLNLGVDSATPAGMLVLQIFAALAEYERESILEKTKAGQLLVKAKGKHIWRPIGLDAECEAISKTA